MYLVEANSPRAARRFKVTSCFDTYTNGNRTSERETGRVGGASRGMTAELSWRFVGHDVSARLDFQSRRSWTSLKARQPRLKREKSRRRQQSRRTRTKPRLFSLGDTRVFGIVQRIINWRNVSANRVPRNNTANPLFHSASTVLRKFRLQPTSLSNSRRLTESMSEQHNPPTLNWLAVLFPKRILLGSWMLRYAGRKCFIWIFNGFFNLRYSIPVDSIIMEFRGW